MPPSFLSCFSAAHKVSGTESHKHQEKKNCREPNWNNIWVSGTELTGTADACDSNARVSHKKKNTERAFQLKPPDPLKICLGALEMSGTPALSGTYLERKWNQIKSVPVEFTIRWLCAAYILRPPSHWNMVSSWRPPSRSCIIMVLTMLVCGEEVHDVLEPVLPWHTFLSFGPRGGPRRQFAVSDPSPFRRLLLLKVIWCPRQRQKARPWWR